MTTRIPKIVALLLVHIHFVNGAALADPPATQPIPLVPVSKPVKRTVTDYADYAARLDARQAVEIKARVTGYLLANGKDKDGKPIEEGSEVQEGNLLFQIDPRPYELLHTKAKSQVTIAESQLKTAQATLEADLVAVKKEKGIISQLQLEIDKAAVIEMQARLEVAKAELELHKLTLEFASVKAPFAGQIGRFYFSPGNLIKQDQTSLTTVVDISQVYAYFDMDQQAFLKLNGQTIAGKIRPPVGKTKVAMSLDGESEFTYSGMLDFIDNKVNPTTGAISVRAMFDNPKSAHGTRVMLPGMFVRTRLQIGEPYAAQLVVDRAIGSDQGLKFVYVVDAENKVQYRRVILGALQDNGLRVIEPYKPRTDNQVESGLRADDLVAVGSLAQLKPGMVIVVNNVDMPVPGRSATKPPATQPEKK